MKAHAPTTIFHTRIAPNFLFSHTFAEVFEFCDDIKVNFTKETFPLERQLIKQILRSGNARVSRDSFEIKQIKMPLAMSYNSFDNSRTESEETNHL